MYPGRYIPKQWSAKELEYLKAKSSALLCTCDKYHPAVWGKMGFCEQHGAIGIPILVPAETQS